MKTDVIVMGAGPAGAATAIFLARRGFDVTLFDRAEFPRSKPCGEYLTPGAVAILRDELGILPTLMDAGAKVLTRETIVTHGGGSFGGETSALACPRAITDAALVNTARTAGVDVREGVGIREILRDGDGRVAGVQTDNGANWQARVTVGADGTHSKLARALGVVRPVRRLQRIALVGHFDAKNWDDEANSVTMHLPTDNSDACCGVGAPCGPDGTRNVNIVVPQSEASKMAGRRDAYFQETLARAFPGVWQTLQTATQIGPLVSVGCFGHHTTRASHDGAVLVGDAATFVHPFTGEGVFFALRGATLAAAAIDAHLRQNHSLRLYDAARRRELLPRYRLCDWVQRVVHSPAALAFAASRLRRSPDLTRALLETVGDVARPSELLTWRVIWSLFSPYPAFGPLSPASALADLEGAGERPITSWLWPFDKRLLTLFIGLSPAPSRSASAEAGDRGPKAG